MIMSIFLIACVYFNSLLECHQNGICFIWNLLKMECALFGMCSKQNVPFFWNVLKKCALLGKCLKSAQNKMSHFWNVLKRGYAFWSVLFLECALFGMKIDSVFWKALFSNELKLKLESALFRMCS